MDSLSICERLVELKREIEQISREDRMYKKKGRFRAPQDVVAHDQRMLRMRQILDEIAQFAKRA